MVQTSTQFSVIHRSLSESTTKENENTHSDDLNQRPKSDGFGFCQTKSMYP